MLGVLVPEVEGSVAAGGAEGAVDGVEGYRVHGVDVADVAVIGWGLAVAFEAEVGGGVFLLDVLDRATAFDGADGEAGGVGEASDDARLPFQGRLDRLVELGRFVQVDDVDVAVCRADDEEVVLAVDAVDSFLAVHTGDGGGLSQIPVFDCFVPGSGDEYGASGAGNVDHTYASDRLVVCGYLLSLGASSGEIQHASCFVCAASNYLCTVLREQSAHDNSNDRVSKTYL